MLTLFVLYKHVFAFKRETERVVMRSTSTGLALGGTSASQRKKRR
jgi:hypothetical protein